MNGQGTHDGWLTARVSGWIKRGLFFYATGVMLTLQFWWVQESLFHLPVWSLPRLLLSAVGVPTVFTVVALWLWRPPESRLPVKLWGLNAVLMFLFWSGGYFLVGYWTGRSGLEPVSLHTWFDSYVPYLPEWVFLYITVYFIFLLPCFFVDDPGRLLVYDLAQLLALGISFAIFLGFPVATERFPIVENTLATWTLSIVHGTDPAWNCFPSTHCTAATIAALAMVREHRRIGTWVGLSALGICLSTLVTRQHFVWDVVAGVLLGGGSYALVHLVVVATPVGSRFRPLLDALVSNRS